MKAETYCQLCEWAMKLDDDNDSFADDVRDFLDKASLRMTEEEHEKANQILSRRHL